MACLPGCIFVCLKMVECIRFFEMVVFNRSINNGFASVSIFQKRPFTFRQISLFLLFSAIFTFILWMEFFVRNVAKK